jgi:hypothetical protein
VCVPGWCITLTYLNDGYDMASAGAATMPALALSVMRYTHNSSALKLCMLNFSCTDAVGGPEVKRTRCVRALATGPVSDSNLHGWCCCSGPAADLEALIADALFEDVTTALAAATRLAACRGGHHG